ncbi:MAG: hypothetical protein ACE5FN_12125 [Leptospirillia bacterium]
MAGRGMSAAMLAELDKADIRPCRLVNFYFDSGTLRYTDAAHNVTTAGGNIYLSDGNLTGVDTIKETAPLKRGSLKVKLSGVPLANIATALTEPYTDRRVTVHIALLDAVGTPIPSPLLVYDGRIDSFELIEKAGGTANVKWDVASHMADFEKTNGRRTNDSEQQAMFPGDDGFKFASTVDPDTEWGS